MPVMPVPDWIPDDDAERCMGAGCGVVFPHSSRLHLRSLLGGLAGLIGGGGFGSHARRRHHCRSCGGVFCDECSRRRAELPHMVQRYGTGPVRVCDACYEEVDALAHFGLLDAMRQQQERQQQVQGVGNEGQQKHCHNQRKEEQGYTESSRRSNLRRLQQRQDRHNHMKQQQQQQKQQDQVQHHAIQPTQHTRPEANLNPRRRRDGIWQGGGRQPRLLATAACPVPEGSCSRGTPPALAFPIVTPFFSFASSFAKKPKAGSQPAAGAATKAAHATLMDDDDDGVEVEVIPRVSLTAPRLSLNDGREDADTDANTDTDADADAGAGTDTDSDYRDTDSDCRSSLFRDSLQPKYCGSRSATVGHCRTLGSSHKAAEEILAAP